jgi:hypothetical protein
MPPRIVAHLIFSCAAVLFLPQALECCHNGSHTILESLSGVNGAMAMQASAQQSHASHILESRVMDPAERTADEQSANLQVTLPAGGESGQSPSLGAQVIGRQISITTGFSVIRPVHHHLTLQGRTDQPGTPPPRIG